MSEAFTPLSAPEAVAAAHRIYDRVDAALTIERGLDGVPRREMISIVILARQLDEIARAAAVHLSRPSDDAARDRLRGLLLLPGYLPIPEQAEPTHGEG